MGAGGRGCRTRAASRRSSGRRGQSTACPSWVDARGPSSPADTGADPARQPVPGAGGHQWGAPELRLGGPRASGRPPHTEGRRGGLSPPDFQTQRAEEKRSDFPQGFGRQQVGWVPLGRSGARAHVVSIRPDEGPTAGSPGRGSAGNRPMGVTQPGLPLGPFPPPRRLEIPAPEPPQAPLQRRCGDWAAEAPPPEAQPAEREPGPGPEKHLQGGLGGEPPPARAR